MRCGNLPLSERVIAEQAIRLHLVRLLPLEEHEAWLQMPRLDLAGRSPAQAIQAGQGEAVLQLLRKL